MSICYNCANGPRRAIINLGTGENGHTFCFWPLLALSGCDLVTFNYGLISRIDETGPNARARPSALGPVLLFAGRCRIVRHKSSSDVRLCVCCSIASLALVR